MTTTIESPPAASSSGREGKTTSREQLDTALAILQNNKQSWAQLSLVDLVALIDSLMDEFKLVAKDWVDAALAAKGISPRAATAGEEWLGGPYSLLRNLRLFRQTLDTLRRKGDPELPGPVRTRASGIVSARVFPTDLYDQLFFMGTTAEIWMEPEVSQDRLKETMCAYYRKPPESGRICLVLGAGNVASIGPMDVIYKMFVERKVALLKMHPVNEYLGPFFERAFQPLISRGFLQIVYGGADVGSYLCNHTSIGEIHITGSDKTHDVIVFGGEVEKRKADRDPFLNKPITSELGNVSPVVIVPGDWSKSDIAFQAANIASSLANNGGFNCNASRVLVMQKGWKHREALLDGIRAVFKTLPQRDAYYPGAFDRHKAFLAEHPDAELIGERTDKKLPWTLIPGLDPAHKDDICFNTEAFCSVFGETCLEAADPAEFIVKATEFANETLWGTLNMTMLIHPSTLADKGVEAAFEKALEDLRYGTISVNHWAAVCYAMGSTTWGAHPGHDIYDIQSGLDVVHNGYMFDKPMKSVVRGPFRPWPKPAWFATHKTSHYLGKKLTNFEASPSPLKLPGIFLEAFLG
ncbi:Aldehyde dehydrogenase family protein [Sulfidibacter corallicola]|uniref:Aldehyde dehydrogenase family protein n=1 Tax=Sulfidibacter corallicola TaxID=2818388 RepID=A0A8A4TKF8_SULCO|nr:aldehyde dehydrogenase family protein [Sulfidibacter corallicola]QTD49957.1 aldehyde dehydrogenase family protein [Sulfidibacter corallicola]